MTPRLNVALRMPPPERQSADSGLLSGGLWAVAKSASSRSSWFDAAFAHSRFHAVRSARYSSRRTSESWRRSIGFPGAASEPGWDIAVASPSDLLEAVAMLRSEERTKAGTGAAAFLRIS